MFSKVQKNFLDHDVIQHMSAPWDSEVDYQHVPSYCVGSDKIRYKSTKPVKGINPVGDSTGSWVKDEQEIEYTSKLSDRDDIGATPKLVQDTKQELAEDIEEVRQAIPTGLEIRKEAGKAFSSNTESNIIVTPQADGTVDLAVPNANSSTRGVTRVRSAKDSSSSSDAASCQSVQQLFNDAVEQSGLKTGDIFYSARTVSTDEAFPCNGAIVNKADVQDIIDAVPDGVFRGGDGVNTIGLPIVTDLKVNEVESDTFVVRDSLTLPTHNGLGGNQQRRPIFVDIISVIPITGGHAYLNDDNDRGVYIVKPNSQNDNVYYMQEDAGYWSSFCSFDDGNKIAILAHALSNHRAQIQVIDSKGVKLNTRNISPNFYTAYACFGLNSNEVVMATKATNTSHDKLYKVNVNTGSATFMFSLGEDCNVVRGALLPNGNFVCFARYVGGVSYLRVYSSSGNKLHETRYGSTFGYKPSLFFDGENIVACLGHSISFFDTQLGLINTISLPSSLVPNVHGASFIDENTPSVFSWDSSTYEARVHFFSNAVESVTASAYIKR